MGNLDLWNSVSRPPKEALKQISGGRLNGKSDINPQWRMKAITEQFGPCGQGWKYTIDRLWTEEGDAGERMAFALVSVFVNRHSQEWSEPVPGIGGSMMIAKERNGLYNSDEAYKMAVTDALSVAFKALGVAAEIYMGNWDGSKYKTEAAAAAPASEASPERIKAIYQQYRDYIASGLLPENWVGAAQYAIDSGETDIVKLEARLVRLKAIHDKALAALNEEAAAN